MGDPGPAPDGGGEGGAPAPAPSPNRRPAPPPLPMLPYLALGLMTLAAFAGPFAIVLVVRGGPRPEWPPDRPVEWWTLGLVSGAVVVLVAACVTVGLWSRPRPGPR